MRLKRIIPFATLLSLSLAECLPAQTDRRGQAAQSLSQVPVTQGQIFQQGTVTTVVTPYQTSAPPETGVTSGSIASDVTLKRITPGPEARALSAAEDSFSNRPQVIIPQNTTLFDRANAAVSTADQTLGAKFDPAGGLCTYSDFGQLATFKRFCARMPNVQTNTCQVARNVQVDRRDTYLCSQQDAHYIHGCDEQKSYSCTPSATCKIGAITTQQVAGLGSVQPVQQAIPGGPVQTALSFQNNPRGLCVLATQTISLDISSDMQIARAEISNLAYSEWVQIVVNGQVVTTLPSGWNAGLLTTQRFRVNIFSTRAMPAINGTRLASSCGLAQRIYAGPINILPYLTLPMTVVNGPAQIAQNTIQIRAVGRTTHARLDLTLDGACCDALTETLVETCDAIIR